MTEPTLNSLQAHFTALQGRVTKQGATIAAVAAGLAALTATIATLTVWQPTVGPEVDSLKDRITVLEAKVAKLEEAPAAPDAIGPGYEPVAFLTSGKPTAHYSCAAFTSPGVVEPYARCTFLGSTTASNENALLLEGPEELKVEVWAKKLGSSES